MRPAHKNLFLIENSDLIAGLLIHQLERKGNYHVLRFSSFDQLKKENLIEPDLIIIDNEVFSTGQFEKNQVENSLKDKDLPVIVLSNKSDHIFSKFFFSRPRIIKLFKDNNLGKKLETTIEQVLFVDKKPERLEMNNKGVSIAVSIITLLIMIGLYYL